MFWMLGANSVALIQSVIQFKSMAKTFGWVNGWVSYLEKQDSSEGIAIGLESD